MKKIIYIYLILLSFYNVFSQDKIKNLSKRDTIYISFDKNESFDDLHLEHTKIEQAFNEIYSYKSLDGKFLAFDFRKSYEVLKKKKSFLSDKKIKLFNIQDFHKIDLNQIIYNLETKKIIIYIIDKNENKGKKISIKRVIMMNKVPIEM